MSRSRHTTALDNALTICLIVACATVAIEYIAYALATMRTIDKIIEAEEGVVSK